LFIYSSKNGATADNYIAQYDKSTDTWDFNTAGLSKKNVPVATTNQLLGVGQRWNVKNSQIENGKVYVNYTGRPIAISIAADGNSAQGQCAIYVDGIRLQHMDPFDTGRSLFIIVPPSSSYKITWQANKPSMIAVLE